jgi:hypothetical protein
MTDNNPHVTPEDTSTTTTTTAAEQPPLEELHTASVEKSDGKSITEEKENASPDDDGVIYPQGLKLVVILTALCCAIFLVALDQTIISTAIPKITDQFNSITDIGWYGSSYLLTATALQPVFGRLYTIFSVCF